MSEELNIKIQESMVELLEYVEQAAAFTVEQAPAVVQELITWGIVSNFLTAVFGTATLVSLWLGTCWVSRLNICECDGKRHIDCWGPVASRIYYVVSAIVLFAIGVLAVLPSFKDALMAYYVPKLYVLEALRGAIQ
jgi:hypothetical protein